MIDFILEKNNFLEEAEEIFNIIKSKDLPFEKNSYNINSQNYEYRNLEKNPDFKKIILFCEKKISREIKKYFEDYQIITGEQKFIGSSVLYLKEGSGIPKHTDDQIDGDIFRNIGVLVYLNSPNGGELIFPLQKRIIKPELGKLVLFPSLYTHPHMVVPAHKGDRYALRFNYASSKSLH